MVTAPVLAPTAFPIAVAVGASTTPVSFHAVDLLKLCHRGLGLLAEPLPSYLGGRHRVVESHQRDMQRPHIVPRRIQFQFSSL